MNNPLSAGSLAFIAWAVSPYLYLAAMARSVSMKKADIAALVLTLVAAAFGLWVIIDAMYVHLDAQGGLVYVFAPLWQWLFLLLATYPLYL